MSDKLREALERAHDLSLDGRHEDARGVIREALAADDAARGTMREEFEAWARGRGHDTDRARGEGYLVYSVNIMWMAWQASRAAAPQSDPISDEEQAALYQFCRGTPHYAAVRRLYRLASAAPQSAEPLTDDELPGMWSHSDLTGGATDCVTQQAATADAEWLEEALAIADGLVLVDGLEDAARQRDALRAHLSTRAAAPQNVKPVAWLAYDGAHQLFIVGGNGPHDLYGGFPVYLRPQQAAPTEADRLDAERYRTWRTHYCSDPVDTSEESTLTRLANAWAPNEVDAILDAAMPAQASGKEQGS